MNLKSGYTKLFFANFTNSILNKTFTFRRFFFLKTFLDFYRNNRKFKALHKLRNFARKKKTDLFMKKIIFIEKRLEYTQNRLVLLTIRKILLNFKNRHPKLLRRMRIKINKILGLVKKKLIKIS